MKYKTKQKSHITILGFAVLVGLIMAFVVTPCMAKAFSDTQIESNMTDDMDISSSIAPSMASTGCHDINDQSPDKNDCSMCCIVFPSLLSLDTLSSYPDLNVTFLKELQSVRGKFDLPPPRYIIS